MSNFFCSTILFFLGIVLAFPSYLYADSTFDEELQQIRILSEILFTIQDEYVEEDKTGTEQLFQGAVKGMMSSLDRYSIFLNPQEAKAFNDHSQGSFKGLGIQADFVDNWLTVIEPIPGTPAAEAGLIGGDRIVEIDGKSTKGVGYEMATSMLQGEIGTDVNLLIARHGEPSLITKTITRAYIETLAVEPGEMKMLDNRIGYIRLRNFTQDAAVELEQSIRELQTQGMQSLILDLRDNVGGVFGVSVDVCDLFLPEDEVVVRQKDRRGRVTTYTTKNSNTGDFLMALLVNEFSASASEIVAGCLKDHRRALLVGPAGHKTFGKGSVQTLIELNNLPGAAIKLTTAKYYTPLGFSIDDEKGLTPDILVPVTETQRVAIRSESKMGYIPPRLLSTQNKGMSTSVEEIFADESGGVEQQDVYDIELHYAYNALKSAALLQGTGQNQYSYANPRN